MEQVELDEWRRKIATMSQVEMAELYRFAPAGHPIMQLPLFAEFEKRFQELGGMTTEVSKEIGWDREGNAP